MRLKIEKEHIMELAKKAKKDLKPLLKYADWLKENEGNDLTSVYDGTQNGSNTMSFPVYDKKLLKFVKEAGENELMDRNYVYVYSELRLETPEQEKQAIEECTIEDWRILCGILTRYVRGGMTRAYLWGQGVKEGIFYLALTKMQEVLETAESFVSQTE